MTITNSSLRLVALVTGVAVALALMGAVAIAPAQAAGLTQTQIQSIVSLLASFGADSATIANVTAALNGQATPGTGSSNPNTGTCPALSRDIQAGSSGADVKSLQVYLNGSADTRVSASGAGSMGNETMTFGPATKAAVIKLQVKLGVTPAAGYVGAKTRAAIAATCGNTTPGNPGTIPTTGGAVSVSAGAQPVNSLAPEGASRVPFTTFTLTNNSSQAVTINSVTVQRVGLGVDNNFSGIVLLDSSGLQIGTAKTLNSNHQANIGDTFTINAGSSMTLTVAGNIADNSNANSGQVVALQVVAINTGATVSGTLPISGASQTINTNLTLGSFSTSTSSFDPGTTQTKSIGDTGVRFSGIRLTAGSAEDLKFYSIRWRQVGTASASDIANIMTVVDGTSYPTTVSADGKYYTTVFAGGLLIAKGNSIDVYVKGDVIGSNSASRTVDFDIDRSTDIYFVGQTYGYGVADTVYPNAQPWFSGYATTIQAGSATTIGKATEVIAQNIAVNVQNQPLGGFVTDFKGEAVSIQGMVVGFNYSSGAASSNLLTNVSIFNENGVVVAGPVDATNIGGTYQKATFTDTITFPTGRHVYTVKGKVPSNVSSGVTITASTTPSSWTNPQGQTSGSTITISQGDFTMNAMTVKGAALAIGMSATPATQTVTAGSQDVVMANVQLDASQSGEDVRVTSLPLVMTLGGSSGAIGDLSSCRLYNGSTQLTTGSNVPSSLAASASATTFTLDNSLTIPKGTVVTLALKCNISSSAASTATYTWSVVGSSFTSTGVTSGVSITETGTGTSGTFSLGSASVTVAIDASSPSYAIAAGGQTGVSMGAYRLRAANDNVNLTKLGLILTSGTAASLGTVYIYDGATLVGTATFLGGSTVATSTFSSPVVLTANVDKILTVKADLADIGVSASGVEGALVKIDVDSTEGNSSSGLVQGANTVGVAGVRVFNTFPTIALGSLPTTGVAGDGQFIRFSVNADSHGSLGVSQFVFNFASSTGVVTSNVALYAYTDAAYSVPANGTSGGVADADPTINAGRTIATSTLDNVIQVAPGAPVYFLLKGTVSYTGSASTYNISTTLKGDTVSTGMIYGSTAQSSYSFVWSPNATTTATISGTGSGDWANGYGVVGLPTIGVTQTRSN